MDKKMKFEGEIIDIERSMEMMTNTITGTVIMFRVEHDESLENDDNLNHVHLGKATFEIKQYGS